MTVKLRAVQLLLGHTKIESTVMLCPAAFGRFAPMAELESLRSTV